MTEFAAQVQAKIDQKTKPPGSLGQLESLAEKIATAQQTLTPTLSKPHVVVFAGDHGLADVGVSAFPKAVTAQMVLNFASGGAAINVFCRQQGMDLTVVDTGVDFDFDPNLPIVHGKVGRGTANMLESSALTPEQLGQCVDQSESLVAQIAADGCNIIGFGEMGIGNTAAASLIMSALYDLPLEVCVGRGTGLDDAGLQNKLQLLRQVRNNHTPNSPEEILTAFGGFEIAHIVGGMLAAASLKMLILVDGFITTAAYAVAYAINPDIENYAIFCHSSAEQGHEKLLTCLDVQPLLQLNMRLGEGSGCPLAYPLVQNAVAFFNEMASFAEAGVSDGNAHSQ
jgi:nicotinate-nucleotide--dimethylbenzimidazole phosphoribosyltransferase